MVDSRLLIATSNLGKIREISTLLVECSRELVFLSDFESPPSEPEEIGSTFAENAQLKARYYAHFSQIETVADDSGLSVLELDGFPGVNSARWVKGTDSERVDELLSLLTNRGLTEPFQRRAFFSCVVSVSSPGQEKTIDFEGICWGSLAHAPLGNSGFGYDPIFIPDGETMTMGQLGVERKNMISARSIAMKKLKTWLQQR